MENSYHYRHFLICNRIANKILGMQPQNFAKLIIDEYNGRTFNSQMTCYFHIIDEQLSELQGNDPMLWYSELDIDKLVDISPEKLREDYYAYCSIVIPETINE